MPFFLHNECWIGKKQDFRQMWMVGAQLLLVYWTNVKKKKKPGQEPC